MLHFFLTNSIKATCKHRIDISDFLSSVLRAQKNPRKMKTLLVILVIAVVAASAHPDRERRSVLGVPLLAPATTLLGHTLGGAIVAAPGHGATVVSGPGGTLVSAAHPWGHAVVAPGLWGW